MTKMRETTLAESGWLPCFIPVPQFLLESLRHVTAYTVARWRSHGFTVHQSHHEPRANDKESQWMQSQGVKLTFDRPFRMMGLTSLKRIDGENWA